MSLMGGGLWGVGFVTVDMRIRKVLKRFLATPMRKSDFLLGILFSRLLFLVPEVLVLLVFARLAFGVVIQGSLLAVVALILFGAWLSRASVFWWPAGADVGGGLGTDEPHHASHVGAIGYLLLIGGFPEAMQPFIKVLPLTPLNALRGVTLEGMTLAALWPQIAILSAWGLGSFVLALRRFRWN